MRRSENCRKKFWNNFLKTIFFLRTKIYLHKSRTGGGRRGEDFRIAQQIWRPPSAESRTPEFSKKSLTNKIIITQSMLSGGQEQAYSRIQINSNRRNCYG